MRMIKPMSHITYKFIQIGNLLEYQMAQTDHKRRRTNRRADETSSPVSPFTNMG